MKAIRFHAKLINLLILFFTNFGYTQEAIQQQQTPVKKHTLHRHKKKPWQWYAKRLGLATAGTASIIALMTILRNRQKATNNSTEQLRQKTPLEVESDESDQSNSSKSKLPKPPEQKMPDFKKEILQIHKHFFSIDKAVQTTTYDDGLKQIEDCIKKAKNIIQRCNTRFAQHPQDQSIRQAVRDAAGLLRTLETNKKNIINNLAKKYGVMRLKTDTIQLPANTEWTIQDTSLHIIDRDNPALHPYVIDFNTLIAESFIVIPQHLLTNALLQERYEKLYHIKHVTINDTAVTLSKDTNIIFYPSTIDKIGIETDDGKIVETTLTENAALLIGHFSEFDTNTETEINKYRKTERTR